MKMTSEYECGNMDDILNTDAIEKFEIRVEKSY